MLRRTDFGHLGIFPEHAPFWQKFHDMVKGKQAKVLNLFAYTGGASLALARAGAEVVHVDASKTSVAWAKENAALSGIETIRWIVEDVRKFVAREKRRGVAYQGIILDPPTYGRGTNNEVWKIDEDLVGLMLELRELLAGDWAFIMLSSHSPGHTPLALENVLRSCLPSDGKIESNEMVAVAKSGLSLPSGAYSLWERV
jgi:23S rRNA (cytosine1962-C5)-methyltransferase